MGLLEDRKALIFGIANRKSIAFSIAKKLRQEGSEVAITYASEPLKKRVVPLSEELDCSFCSPCDVTKDDEVEKTFKTAEDKLHHLDILIHSVAFAPYDDLKGRVVDVSRDGFKTALEISAYSLIAVTRAAVGLMKNGGSIITMTYYGAQKVILNYNLMGIAKATLESSVKYLAHELGEKNIRINAISAGPIRTLASSGVSNFKSLSTMFVDKVPLRKSISQNDVADAALFLSSDLSKNITGEILFVDGGYNILGY